MAEKYFIYKYRNDYYWTTSEKEERGHILVDECDTDNECFALMSKYTALRDLKSAVKIIETTISSLEHRIKMIEGVKED